MTLIRKYKLKKDLPNLNKGAIFEHREYDHRYPDRGNLGCGVLILGWLDGSCQQSWAGETYILPGQLVDNEEWFEELDLDESIDFSTIAKNILNELDNLKNLVKNKL